VLGLMGWEVGCIVLTKGVWRNVVGKLAARDNLVGNV